MRGSSRRSRSRRPRRRPPPERGDLLGVVAGLGEHRVGVLRRAPGRRASRRAGVRDSLTGAPSRRTGARRPGWSTSTTISRARTARTRAPRRARAPAPGSSRARRRTPPTRRACARRRSPRPRVRPRAGRLELALDQVLAPDAARTRRPRTSARARRARPSRRRTVGPVAEQPAGQLELAAPRRRAARRGSARRPSPASDSAPSVIETSTSWPSPERSRSRSAARIPNAAISAPPPRSAIWPAACTGGPSALAASGRAARRARGSSMSCPARSR